MKKIISITAAFSLFAGVSFAQEWNLDKTHSQLNFAITHNTINEIDGTFGAVNAKFTSAKEDLTDAVVELTADASSFNTGNEQRNNHIKSADFLDAAQFPTISFKSTSFKKVSGKNYKLAGDLTIHGVTKPVVLNVVFNGTIVNPQNKKTVAGFKVTGAFKRTDFGVASSFPTAVVSDEFALNANVEFIKD